MLTNNDDKLAGCQKEKQKKRDPVLLRFDLLAWTSCYFFSTMISIRTRFVRMATLVIHHVMSAPFYFFFCHSARLFFSIDRLQKATQSTITLGGARRYRRHAFWSGSKHKLYKKGRSSSSKKGVCVLTATRSLPSHSLGDPYFLFLSLCSFAFPADTLAGVEPLRSTDQPEVVYCFSLLSRMDIHALLRLLQCLVCIKCALCLPAFTCLLTYLTSAFFISLFFSIPLSCCLLFESHFINLKSIVHRSFSPIHSRPSTITHSLDVSI